MTEDERPETVFGMMPEVMLSVGDYWDYSHAALNALVDKRHYECVAICAVLVDVIMSDILENISDADELRRKPVGAMLKALAKQYTNDREVRLLRDLEILNKLRVRVVHPGSDPKLSRIGPENCSAQIAQEFFDQLERVVDGIGGYSNRQFGQDLEAFFRSRGVSDEDT